MSVIQGNVSGQTVSINSLAIRVQLFSIKGERGNVEGKNVGLYRDLEPRGSFRCFRPRLLSRAYTTGPSSRAGDEINE